MIFRLYPHCLPYGGPADGHRETAIASFLRNRLPVEDVSFTEEGVPHSDAVRPVIAIGYGADPQAPLVTHERLVVATDAALKATGMQAMGAVLTERNPHPPSTPAGRTATPAGLAGGAATAARLAGTWIDGRPAADQARALVLSAFAFDALFGGLAGAQIARDGRVLGYWTRDGQGVWHWHAADDVLGVAVRRRGATGAAPAAGRPDPATGPRTTRGRVVSGRHPLHGLEPSRSPESLGTPSGVAAPVALRAEEPGAPRQA